MNDVFISYAREDGDWAERLAARLRDNGARVFFDRWSLSPGAVVVHELDAAIRAATHGIHVFSPASAAEPWVCDEYAALFRASVTRGLRFIPVVYGDTAIPPLAETRLWADFRGLEGPAFDLKAAELARAVRGEPHTALGEAARATDGGPVPLTAPARPGFVVCYARSDAGYGERLAGHIAGAGLPVWSIAHLTWGDDYIREIRRRLRHAVAIVVLMSPEAEDSEDMTRKILEGQRHGRDFFPVLVRGGRHYLLASSWYFDARAGVLPGPAEMRLLRRLYDAHDGALRRFSARTRPSVPSRSFGLPRPPAASPARPARLPAGASLGRLRGFLAEGEIEHADLLTTTILLEAVGRQESGWMLQADAARLETGLLDEVNAAWAASSGGLYGFEAQRKLARARGGLHSDFLELSVKYGWRASADDTVPRYEGFAGRGEGRAGFFPTLRNPQNERYLDWYDQWTETVLAVHRRLLRWWGPR